MYESEKAKFEVAGGFRARRCGRQAGGIAARLDIGDQAGVDDDGVMGLNVAARLGDGGGGEGRARRRGEQGGFSRRQRREGRDRAAAGGGEASGIDVVPGNEVDPAAGGEVDARERKVIPGPAAMRTAVSTPPARIVVASALCICVAVRVMSPCMTWLRSEQPCAILAVAFALFATVMRPSYVSLPRANVSRTRRNQSA
jgi:hypothetical protein